MGLISSILPGLRELRAPLASGYLWLVTLAILLREHVPRNRSMQPPLLRDLIDFLGWLGKAGIFSALSFAAYLIGIFSCTVSLLALRGLSMWHPGKSSKYFTGMGRVALSRKGVLILRDVAIDRVWDILNRDRESSSPTQAELRLLNAHPEAQALIAAIVSTHPDIDGRALIHRHFDLMGHVQAIAADLELMPVRLIREQTELYSDWDRLHAEGEFRAALALPATAGIIATALNLSLLPALLTLLGACLFCMALMLQGRGRILSANDHLAAALRASAGSKSPAVAAMTPGVLVLANSHLLPNEIDKMYRLAEAGQEMGRIHESARLYGILAKTGDRDANELFYTLTEDLQTLANVPLLDQTLAEGMTASGVLALKRVLLLLERDPQEYEGTEGLARAIGDSLINATCDERTSELAWQIIERCYQHLKNLDSLTSDVKLVQAGNLPSGRIYRKYEPPPLDVFRQHAPAIRLLLDQLEGGQPSWLPVTEKPSDP